MSREGVVVPNFNLTCNIWTRTLPPPGNAPRLTSPCNLQYSKKLTTKGDNVTGARNMSMWLLLPAMTDVRGPLTEVAFIASDYVECPAGSSRWYQVVAVDDVSKGFASEYRCALIEQIQSGALVWPVPMP